jgi:hypothetical protein
MCLPHSLKSFHEFWNYKYNYPVYVHYFDDIYDDENLRNAIRSFSKVDVNFISVPYETPNHIHESELFYNRKDIEYVRNGFGPHRKGYLHMCHYFNNLYKYPNTQFHKYDYMLSIDDESLFLKEVPYDFFEVMSNRPERAGAIKVTDPSIKKPHKGNFDTRIGMMDFVLKYIRDNNISPKCEFIESLCKVENKEEYFHSNLLVGDSWIFETKMFETEEWKNWSGEVNKNGGVYKYRWGDCELIFLFLMIHYGEVPYDFKTVDEGYHNQGALRHIQNNAPSIKNFMR